MEINICLNNFLKFKISVITPIYILWTQPFKRTREYLIYELVII